MRHLKLLLLLCSICCLLTVDSADARRRRTRRARRQGPPPTHPVLLWAKTLDESTDLEQRKIAAFKLSQYSQTIFQDQVVNTILKCTQDENMELQVLCTKALGRAGTQGHIEKIRTALLDLYKEDTFLRNTIVRTFITRKDNAQRVQDAFIEVAKNTTKDEELLVLLSYLAKLGHGDNDFVTTLVEVYKKQSSTKLKRAVIKVLSERAEGQDQVIEVLAGCAVSNDTPLALTCLSGLEAQAKKDARAWSAVEKTIESEDPDVLLATLDVINALPETPNIKLSKRLVQIVSEVEDTGIQEKAVLALGVCGDSSTSVVETLKAKLSNPQTDEAVRIASALIMGKQGATLADSSKTILGSCSKTGVSQNLRTACMLGLRELELKIKAIAENTTVPTQQAGAAEKPREKASEPKDALATDREPNA